jgi:hypothetical protein
MVAGSGDATATNPGTPSSDNSGVATEEPPTPNSPVSVPIAAPASKTSGAGATT